MKCFQPLHNTNRKDSFYLREKLSKKLGVSLPLDKDGAKKLKEQRRDLTEQNGSLRPKLGQIHAELDQLSKLRYWTRKAIPEALPERDDFSEQMEARENRRELEQVMDAAIEAVTQETDEQQPVQDAQNRSTIRNGNEKLPGWVFEKNPPGVRQTGIGQCASQSGFCMQYMV